MRPRLLLLALTALATASCGLGGPPSPPALAYGLPEPAELTYLRGDTARLELSLGGQPLQAGVASEARLGLTFARGGAGLRVTVDVEEFAGRLTQPMGPATTADESGVEGALTFSLSRRGAVSEVASPELEGAAAELLEPLTLAHGLFPRLPGTAARTGDQWTDTVRFEGETDGGRVNVVSVRTYTLAGDSVLAGRSLAHVRWEGETQLTTRGSIAGMNVSQRVRGGAEGAYLFDAGRSVLVESHERTDLRGTMEVSAAPAPLELRLRQRTTVTRVGGP